MKPEANPLCFALGQFHVMVFLNHKQLVDANA